MSGINLDEQMNNALKRWYERKQGTNPDAYLTYMNAQQMYNGIKEGMNQELKNNIPFASPEHRLLLNLKHNTAVTAVFKNHHNHEEVAKLMFDAKGKVRSFNEFKNLAMPIMDKYNKTWLEAEYQTCKASARSAAQFQEFQKKGGKLTFKTQGDGAVRDTHKLLNGVTYPVDHEFWNTHLPPLDWRCRCYFRWTPDSTPTKEPTDGLPDVKPMFQNNPAKSLQVFNEETPYFEVDAKNEAKALKKWNMSLPLNKQEIDRNIDLYKTYSNNKDLKQEYVDLDSGGFVFSHKNADKSDLATNIKAAKILTSDKGLAIQIREHVLTGGKNPELLINNTIKSDLKTPEVNTTGAFNNRFKSAHKQGITNLVLDTVNITDKNTIIEGLIRGFRNFPDINDTYVIVKNKAIHITRYDYKNNLIKDLIEGI